MANIGPDGVVQLYPTAATNGTTFSIGNGTVDVRNSSHMSFTGSNINKHTQGSLTYWSIDDDNATVHINMFASTSVTDQTYNWKTGAISHGYLYNSKDIKTQEFTAFVRVHNIHDSGEEVSMKFRSGRHTGTSDPRSSCFNCQYPFSSSASSYCNKELNHPDYDFIDASKTPRQFTGGFSAGQWVGLKVISINVDSSTVKNMMYVDKNPINSDGSLNNNFKLYYTYIDKQGTDTGRYTQVCSWGGMNTVRIDEVDTVDFALLSVRNIDPSGGSGGGTGGGTSPPPTTNGGIQDLNGTVLVKPKLKLVYWGDNWSTTAAPNKATIDAAFQSLCSDPAYFTALGQYRNISNPVWGNTSIIKNTNPPNPITDAAVGAMLQGLFTAGTITQPVTDPNSVYLVIPKQGTTLATDAYTSQGYHGYAGFGTPTPTRFYYCWTKNDGTINTITKGGTKEIINTMSDPDFNAIHVLGGTCHTNNAGLLSTDYCELADLCTSISKTLDSGIVVQGYYDNINQVCVIPTTAAPPPPPPIGDIPGSGNPGTVTATSIITRMNLVWNDNFSGSNLCSAVPIGSGGDTTGGGGTGSGSGTIPPGIVKDGGGLLLNGPKIKTIFWDGPSGSNWSDLGISKSSFMADMQAVTDGPYFSKLRQYRNIKKPVWAGYYTNDITPYPSSTTAAIEGQLLYIVLDDMYDAGKLSKPSSDPNVLYMVMVKSPYKIAADDPFGFHTYGDVYSVDPSTGNAVLNGREWIGYVKYTTRAFMSQTWMHEVCEAVTDPNIGDGLYIDSTTCCAMDPGYCGGDCEISDVCDPLVQTINGISHQGYYSNLDSACVIPTTEYTP